METSIEKIKAYHNIKSFLNEQERNNLANILNLNETDLNIRLQGKDNEIEFILMLHMLRSCKNIIAFEESVSSLTKTYTPDLLVEWNTGNKVLIEIKSTKEDKYKISKNNFRKKLKFAESFGFDLYFAIKIETQWMLFDSDFIKSRGFKINIKDLKYSKLNQLTGNKIFIFPEGLEILSYYSKSKLNNLGCEYKPYGNLIMYTIMYHGNIIFKIDMDAKENIQLTFLCEAIEETASFQSHNIDIINNDITCIKDRICRDSIIDSRMFVQTPILHMIEENGNRSDLNSYFRMVASNEQNFPMVDRVYEMIELFKKKGLPITEANWNQIDWDTVEFAQNK